MNARRDRFLGIVQTLTRHGLGFSLPYLQLEHHVSRIPLARFGTVEDIANAVVFLASEQSSYLTGQTLNVNGGMVM